MRLILNGFYAATVLSITCESFALAENVPVLDANQRIQLSLYGLGTVELTPEVEGTIAAWTDPIIVTVEEGQSAREAALQACPNVGESYFDVFENNSSDLNPHIQGGIDVNEPLQERSILLAPNCVQRNAERVIITDNQVVERDIWKKYKEGLEEEVEFLGVAPSDLTHSIATLNSRSVASMNDLQAGEQILVPLPRADFVTTPEGLEAITGAVTQSFGTGVIAHELYNSLSNGQFSNSPDGVTDTSFNNCSGVSDAALHKQHLAHFAKMHEALYWNLRQARANKPLKVSPTHTNVVIFDIGLPHSEWWLHGNSVAPMVFGDQQSVMADSQTASQKIDEFKKTGLFDHESLERALNRPLHTEKVLGAAMGGYYEYMFNSSFGVINPSVKRIFKADLSPGNDKWFLKLDTSDLEIENAIETANDQSKKSYIVNISAGAERDPKKFIYKAMAKAKDDLFIVSAGNFRSNQNLDQSKFYPANYGGTYGQDLPLITVGGFKWVFSNSSSAGIVEIEPWDKTNHGDHVDLMALGCDVPTVEFSGANSRNFATIDYENGTSLAAPRVTYTAAMVRHLMSHREPLDSVGYNVPMRIKHRILASSDLLTKLENHSVDGRVLNFAKAINIFSDIVDMGSHSYLRGKVEFADTTFTCSGQEKFNTQDILKIARRIDPKDANKIDYVYYFVKDNSPTIEKCLDWRKPDMYFIPFSLSSKPDAQPIKDFVDIVFSMYSD